METWIPNARTEAFKKLQQKEKLDGVTEGKKSIPLACHLGLLRTYLIFISSWEHRESSSPITLASKHPISVMLQRRGGKLM